MPEDRKLPAPLRHSWEHGTVRCTVICIPPRHDQNWSLKDLYTQEAADSPLGRRVAEKLHAFGVRQAFAPSIATMNARIVETADMTTQLDLGHGLSLYRNQALLADGLPLDPDSRQSMWMSGGGCPFVVAIGGGKVIAAHASRDSLIDRKRILNGTPGREHESVLHAIRNRFDRWGIPTGSVAIWVLFTVPAKMFEHPFDDPKGGKENLLLYEDLITRRGFRSDVMEEGSGRLSIPGLVRGISKQLGFRSTKAFCTLPSAGSFGHTRHPNATFKGLRNLEGVLVERIR